MSYLDMLIFTFANLLAATPIVVYWFVDFDVLREIQPLERVTTCILCLSPVLGNLIVLVYDIFFFAGRGVPGHQYLFLILSPIALLFSLFFLALIVYRLISKARIKRK